MDIVCAGYWKTGSKSCSSALRVLGYNVADAVETGEHLGVAWLDFIEKRNSIDDVIAEYKRYGYQVNQDLPGNFLFEQLYNASPNAKVILTVRDSDEAWLQSWQKFTKQECERYGNPGCYLMQKFIDLKMPGPKALRFQALAEYCLLYAMPGFDPNNRQFTWQGRNEYQRQFDDVALQNYRKHNIYVQAIIPSDRLLVWNVKDGWEPLCKFLGKPIPDIPIPHDNVTGDSKFIEKYIFESDYGKEIMSYLKWNTALLLCKVGLYTAFAIHQYKTDGKFVKSVGTKIINNASKLALWT